MLTTLSAPGKLCIVIISIYLKCPNPLQINTSLVWVKYSDFDWTQSHSFLLCAIVIYVISIYIVSPQYRIITVALYSLISSKEVKKRKAPTTFIYCSCLDRNIAKLIEECCRDSASRSKGKLLRRNSSIELKFTLSNSHIFLHFPWKILFMKCTTHFPTS